MKKVLSVLWLMFLVGGASLVLAQENNTSTDIVNMGAQQVNTDEGYGANDEEYNSSEGITNTTAPADTNVPVESVPPAAEPENTEAPAGQ